MAENGHFQENGTFLLSQQGIQLKKVIFGPPNLILCVSTVKKRENHSKNQLIGSIGLCLIGGKGVTPPLTRFTGRRKTRADQKSKIASFVSNGQGCIVRYTPPHLANFGCFFVFSRLGSPFYEVFGQEGGSFSQGRHPPGLLQECSHKYLRIHLRFLISVREHFCIYITFLNFLTDFFLLVFLISGSRDSGYANSAIQGDIVSITK